MSTDTRPPEEEQDDDGREPLAELAEHRDQYEKLARMDLPISDEAQRVLNALDNWEGQS